MTKLCPRGKAAAKRKFKVYPSAYANAYASKICAGKIKDPSGTKRKDFKGPKPAGAKKGAMMIIIGIGKKKKVDKKMMGGMPTAGAMSGMGRLQKAQMNKGGGADTGTMGERKSRLGVAINRVKRLGKRLKDKDRLTERDIEFAKKEAKLNKMNKGGYPEKLKKSQVGEGRSKAKKVKSKLRNFKNQTKGFLKEMTGFNKGGGADYMNTVKAKKRGNPAVVGSPPKKRSGGGMVRGFGAAIRGKNFEGVF